VTEQSPLSQSPSSNITDLLLAWSDGDLGALHSLLELVYADLHQQAARALRREAPGHSFEATALVHEAYLRLIDQNRVRWQNRGQFFGIAAQLIRRILVDHARARKAAKRGGGVRQITLSQLDAEGPASDSPVDVVDLHEALERLMALDPDQGRLVELRYFAGLSIEETAEALGISPATVKREWAFARAWLRRELTS
jgi:RNA polymerase sigma factor (TIGR02999 family)